MAKVRRYVTTTDDVEIEVVEHHDQRDGPWQEVEFRNVKGGVLSLGLDDWDTIVNYVAEEVQ